MDNSGPKFSTLLHGIMKMEVEKTWLKLRWN